jgi:hypothetical protein
MNSRIYQETIETINLKLQQANNEYIQTKREFDNISIVYNTMLSKLNENASIYNSLLKQKNKLLKTKEDNEKRAQQKEKDKLFYQHYQRFLNSINNIYNRYLPIAQKNNSLKDAYYIKGNISRVDFDKQTLDLKTHFKTIKNEFNTLIQPMCQYCDHPKYSNNPQSHFVNLVNGRLDDTGINNMCLVLHTEVNQHQVGKFNIWSGGYNWNEICTKCKTVQMREREVSR